MTHQTDTPCPVARSLNIIGDRWSLLIIRDAFDGIKRFSDFQKNLNVAKNILSDRLHKLIAANILTTQPASDGSAYLQYVLTERGQALFPVIVAMRQWGEYFLFNANETHSLLVDNTTGKTLQPMQPTNTEGKILKAHDTHVQKLSTDEKLN